MRSLSLLPAALAVLVCVAQPVAAAPASEPTVPQMGSQMRHVLYTIGELPFATRVRILLDREPFIHHLAQVLAGPPELVWLVDKQHPLPADYEPDDLVELINYPSLSLNRPTHQLRQLIIDDLLAMSEAASDSGTPLLISSTYRSYADQQRIYAYWVDELGQAEADRVSARPGRSQHQLGTTVDFGCICPEFADTSAGRWMAEHAWKYGFSMSYPEGAEELTGYDYESWHFRYIGRSAAFLEHTYFAGLQQHLLEFLHRLQNPDAGS